MHRKSLYETNFCSEFSSNYILLSIDTIFQNVFAFFYRSLSLSPKVNTNHEPTNEYNGVHHVFELEGPIASGTRIVFMHGDADNVLFGDEAVIYF